jgi:porin
MKRQIGQRNVMGGAVCLSAASIIFAGMCTPAGAQSQVSPNPQPPGSAAPYSPPAASPLQQPPANPQPSGVASPNSPAATLGPVAQLVSFGNSLGKTLADQGIYLLGSYTENMGSLVSGGVKTGTIPNGELSFGVTLDLQKILGIPEGSFHVIFDERNGNNLNNTVGTSSGVFEGGIGPTRATRLSEFYYEQGFDHDRIDIQVGRTNPTNNFATNDLDIACSFVAGYICAQPSSFYFSNQSIAFPASTWGGFLNIQTTAHTYFRTGVYDDDISQLLGNQQGFNFNVKGSVGVFLPLEIGYQTSFSDSRYPGKYDIGGYWDDADYTTPQGVPMRGRTAYYAQASQTVWRPNPNTKQSVTVFGGGMWYNGGAPYWAQLYAGAYDRGPFTSLGRPDDTIGVIGTYYANNSNQHGNGPNQWLYELNYNFQVVPGLTVKPFTQYAVAPNNLLDAFGTKEPKNAWVVGFQVSIDFGAFFGLPQFVAY